MKLSSKLDDIAIAITDAADKIIEAELGEISESEYYDLKDRITDWVFTIHGM